MNTEESQANNFDGYWARLCRATPEVPSNFPDGIIKMTMKSFKHEIAKAYRAGRNDMLMLKSAQSNFDGGDVTDFLGGLFQ